MSACGPWGVRSRRRQKTSTTAVIRAGCSASGVADVALQQQRHRDYYLYLNEHIGSLEAFSRKKRGKHYSPQTCSSEIYVYIDNRVA